jgi:hypothetical protein
LNAIDNNTILRGIMENLELWDKVRTPDPKYTKTFKRAGGFSGISTNTQYLIQRATELWGENGTGWGVVIDDEDYLSGAPLIVDGGKVGNEIIHVVRGHFWYMAEGKKRTTSQQFGQTTFVGTNKYGFYTDEEAPKKSVTDMMLKCMSLIGFSADIFLGLWDDNKYVNDAKKKFAPKNTPTLDEDKAIKAIDIFADDKDTRPPQVKLKLLKEMWARHYLPKLDQFSKKGKTDVTNTYSGVVDTLQRDIDDENNK